MNQKEIACLECKETFIVNVHLGTIETCRHHDGIDSMESFLNKIRGDRN